ncbi:flagellar hook-basal body complex protein FliE [Nioella sediminis]|jgi:flagellar hook-basal body complex protein FliE|uniref:flagellar hook-basal body complex protein FliE n=1 Tax=Nioella sediminis TaxID=1912092 RepID=UPI0008FD069F|nr:flagellar hook-basal body complex protein FliE [Nioella sediminis]TBX28467.1 flagellar hook-basal body protein FliE [Roseovarius sp. JS7-11]
MDIRTSLAAQGYGQARNAARPTPQDGEGQTGAADVFSQAVRSFTQTVQQGEETARAALTTGADPHALVTALAQTELAVETAVTVRDKVVEAYQEILRMPV